MIPSELLRLARRIQIRSRRALAGQWAGLHQSALKGVGLAFEEVRAYQPGDDVRAIDAKVTARMGRPFIKLFGEEHQRTVWLLVDQSSSMRFGSIERTKLDAAIEVAALLGFAAVANQDKAGLITCTESPVVIPPGRGQRHALRLVRELLVDDGADSASHSAANSGLESAVATLTRLKRARGLVFVVSDFLFPQPQRLLRPLRRRHEVFAIHLIDAIERRLPDVGLARFQDSETGRLVLIDTGSAKFRAAYEAAGRKRQFDLRTNLSSSGIRHVPIDTERSIVAQIIRKLRAPAARS